MNKFFEAMGRNLFATLTMVLAACFIAYKSVVTPQAGVGLASVAIWCVVFALACVVLLLDVFKAELAKLLEPKTGSGSAGSTHDDYSDKAHRQRLELAAMHSLAGRALDMGDHRDAGAGVRQALMPCLAGLFRQLRHTLAVPMRGAASAQSHAVLAANPL